MAKSIYTPSEIKQFQIAKEKGYDLEIFHNYNKQRIWNSPSVTQLDKIPSMYSQEKKGDKAKIYMKLFTPDRTYYIKEFDKKTGNMYGYVKVEGGESEWGYTNIKDLKKGVATSKGLYYLDRDRYFKPTEIKELKLKGEIK